MKITKNALKILKQRYLKKGETWEKLCERVADKVASDEKKSQARSKWFKAYQKIMLDLDFLPNSPTLRNFGRDGGCGSACFVLPIENGRRNIFRTLSDAVDVQTYGGGTGMSFSRLRPKGDLIDSTGMKASGPVAFIGIFDYIIGDMISQGGFRPGANMGILRVDHPDIEAFITAKSKEGVLKNFNLSVGVTDAFMKAVENDEDFDLVFNKKVYQTLPARTLWGKIVKSAWKNGEPGIVFLDTINRANPLRPIGEIEATNPCGEQPLLPYGSCNLGSINLSNMIKGDWIEKQGEIDWKKLRETIKIAVRFLDSVISVNLYPVPEIEKAAKKTRQIGLGIMGFADICIKLHIRYGSLASVNLAKAIMTFIYTVANETSVKLGKEKGMAPVYSEYELPAPKRRNVTLTSIAPTGTLSIIANCSPGCEPHFAFDYSKQCLEGETIAIVPAIVQEWIRRKGRDAPLPEHFITAGDIPMEEHILVQAAFQTNGVDAGVSKTINAPEKTDKNQVSDTFFKAWKMGCKGITFYRDGSRKVQPLHAEKRKETQD